MESLRAITTKVPDLRSGVLRQKSIHACMLVEYANVSVFRSTEPISLLSEAVSWDSCSVLVALSPPVVKCRWLFPLNDQLLPSLVPVDLPLPPSIRRPLVASPPAISHTATNIQRVSDIHIVIDVERQTLRTICGETGRDRQQP
ncbi:uncharacterized protein PV07_10749 [Cladophialophora immunda]|uniref:Uncharacterized protein n=1 Tax=Cladophialophora immunda TaxID=569365 RepID=A0A0D2AJM5_9EURO|nr:uncharacterized protein PV07_10749 [Cladophialophora immunda]KIW25077.1 hypothetical protein PV07_10749 [Cladophialophora immunda]